MVNVGQCAAMFTVTHECVIEKLKYSASVLGQLRNVDVMVTRSTRKTIFSHGLWCPLRIRMRRSDIRAAILMTSPQRSPSMQCIWSPSIALECWSSVSSSRDSSQTPRQQLMTSLQSSPSRQCIWSPSIALECSSSALSSCGLLPLSQLMTSTLLTDTSPQDNSVVAVNDNERELWPAQYVLNAASLVKPHAIEQLGSELIDTV
jgi:hypothetical protein